MSIERGFCFLSVISTQWGQIYHFLITWYLFILHSNILEESLPVRMLSPRVLVFCSPVPSFIFYCILHHPTLSLAGRCDLWPTPLVNKKMNNYATINGWQHYCWSLSFPYLPIICCAITVKLHCKFKTLHMETFL